MIPARYLVRDATMALWDWMLPPTCLVCHLPIIAANGEFLCTSCRAEIRVLLPIDCLCRGGDYSTWDERQRACEFCRRLPQGFDSMRSAFPYAGVIGELIRNLKYRHGQVAGRAVAQLCLAAAGNDLIALRDANEIDLVCPVPMFFARQWKRGYNQAACIAQPLAEMLKLDFDDQAARRCRRTPPQARRAKTEERLQNVADAFDVPAPERVHGRRILLVDDVATTGATVASCAAALRLAGAQRVHIFTVCRAGGHPSEPAPDAMRKP